MKRGRIDKSVLTFGVPVRIRSTEHLDFVRSKPCCACPKAGPSEAHHLTHAQPKAKALKAGDQFTVPLCTKHHRELHARGDEAAWWLARGINPIEIAAFLWRISPRLRAAQ